MPSAWLQEVGIEPAEIAAPRHREELAILTVRLLHEAERYYRSGDLGLWHLSFRSACAVTAARHIHGFAVGNKLFGGIAVVADALLTDKLKAFWAPCVAPITRLYVYFPRAGRYPHVLSSFRKRI